MPDFVHQPVMLAETLAALEPKPEGRYVDGTLGGGGHAAAILRASAPSGWLYGCDCDDAAISAASSRLSEFAGRFELRRANYSALAEWVPAGSCDGVLLDLGVSSPQLDRPERGFSFLRDGPLDMRLDQRTPRTAADLINEAPVEALAQIFWEFGQERSARKLARVVGSARRLRRLETTRQLADVIEQAEPRRGRKIHPATQVFQALRIAVNEELDVLERGLAAAWTILRPGGRMVVLTFHSLEDRVVKRFGRTRALDYDYSGPVDVPELRRPRPPLLAWVVRGALGAGPAEIAANPRARSAHLRAMMKL